MPRCRMPRSRDDEPSDFHSRSRRSPSSDHSQPVRPLNALNSLLTILVPVVDLMAIGVVCPLLRTVVLCVMVLPVAVAASLLARAVVSSTRRSTLSLSSAAFIDLVSTPPARAKTCHRIPTRIKLSTAAEPQKEADSSSSGPAAQGDMPSPWAEAKIRGGKNKARFRQHVNPLARRYQMETELPQNWPRGTFDDPSLPLHLDIGCGKGGFLLELATTRLQQTADKDVQSNMNYLGLEIRPNVARHAQERVARWNLTGKLDFIGCNANVDLRRLLTLYQENGGGNIDFVSIQFPDPHFKSSHAKRRVVTPELVTTLADFLAEGKDVFIQSDVKDVFDDMRERFRDQAIYFVDTVQDFDKYLPANPMGVPTEREISVLDQDLPVYRAIFKRSANAVEV